MNDKTMFGITIYKMCEKDWSVGMCFTHSFKETYLYINLVKVSIAIGVMMGKDKRIEIEL